MTVLQNTAVRTRTFVVGVVDDRWAGSLAYALRTALTEPARVHVVRVSMDSPSSRIDLRLPISTIEAVGDPLDVLLEASRGADLLVIQSPDETSAAASDPLLDGLRRAAESLLVEVDQAGEIIWASDVTGGNDEADPHATADAPAVRTVGERVICVGVDSSAASDAAVAWAVDMAERTPSKIRLISVFGNGPERTQEHAQADLARATELVGDASSTCIPVQGEAAEGLLGASEGAAMLVLGRHGTRGLIHSALGSVGETCARLAGCPVVIVPASA